MFYTISGNSGSGKSTFCSMCKDYAPIFVEEFSTIDCVKNLYKITGWDGVKTPETRNILYELKCELMKYNKMPYYAAIQDAEEWIKKNYQRMPYNTVCFINTRDFDEVAQYKEEFNAKSILVVKDGIGSSGAYDQDFSTFEPDILIRNNGTLNELRGQALNFLLNDTNVTII